MARDVKPEDDENATFVERMLSEPGMLVTAGCIFAFLVVVYEWEAVLAAITSVFSR